MKSSHPSEELDLITCAACLCLCVRASCSMSPPVYFYCSEVSVVSASQALCHCGDGEAGFWLRVTTLPKDTAKRHPSCTTQPSACLCLPIRGNAAHLAWSCSRSRLAPIAATLASSLIKLIHFFHAVLSPAPTLWLLNHHTKKERTDMSSAGWDRTRL